MIVKAINSDIKNRTYFIAGGVLSFKDIVDKICKILLKKARKIHIPEFAVKFLDASLLQDKICKTDDVKKDFGFNPTAFENGIEYIKN